MDHGAYILFDQGPDGGQQAFAGPEHLIVAWEPADVAGAFAAMQQAQGAGKWLAGYASYELGYVLEPRLAPRFPLNRALPLICFGVFDGPHPAATHALLNTAAVEREFAGLTTPEPVWSEAKYSEAFAIVMDYIKAGDFYQTNLSFPMRATWSGSALGLYAALQRVQPVKFGSVLDLGVGPVLLSRSPELFFQLDATGAIRTRPMKGTVPRGKTVAEDAELAAFLASDPKNRAENLMIVDLLRNDLSRIAKVGSVRVPELFTIEEYATVRQMTSLVQAELAENVGISDLFHALFPCGSVTGAPKVRAMEVISDLENEPRGIYCGCIGWIAPDRSATFNVAIRTLSLYPDGAAHLNVGGGVVYDSTGPSEYEEALWKARYTTLPPPVSG